MRRSLSLIFVVVGMAGWFGCGSESDTSKGFKCSETTIGHGQTVNCESGQFDDGTPTSYLCGPAASVTTKTLSPRSGVGLLSAPCPVGTFPLERPIAPSGSSSGNEGASSSSSSGGSSSGGSSGTEPGTGSSTSSGGSSGGESSGGESSGGESSGGESSGGGCESGYVCTTQGEAVYCVCTKCEKGYKAVAGACVPKGNNGVGNGIDPQPPGNPPVNDGDGTSPGHPGNKGGK
jgi:hypothetical protein